MEYLLTAAQMKQIDRISINEYQIPSLVLMERAALAVTACVRRWCERKEKNLDQTQILCLCGSGNNGADGLAVARQLKECHCPVTVLLAGDPEHGTPEFRQQLEMVRAAEIPFAGELEPDRYALVIDAIFGIGLNRPIEGQPEQYVKMLTNAGMPVISVDIPSGIDASAGKVLGCAVQAEETVTFGYQKRGMVFYPGSRYAGQVTVAQIGFAGQAIGKICREAEEQTESESVAYTYTETDLQQIPQRRPDSNKGSYGKVLLVAGSAQMGGAAVLAAMAAYRTGTGLVKVFTHEANRTAILRSVPEAVCLTYGQEDSREKLLAGLREELNKVDCVVIGPGLSMADQAVWLTEEVLRVAQCPVIVDADALNICARAMETGQNLLREASCPVIITPHLGEMSRLQKRKIEEIKADPVAAARQASGDWQVICVLKDARTVVADHRNIYLNLSGNNGMSTGGSGDVLTGIIAGLLAQGMEPAAAARMGVYLHGAAGDAAAQHTGTYGLMAEDIVHYLVSVLK